MNEIKTNEHKLSEEVIFKIIIYGTRDHKIKVVKTQYNNLNIDHLFYLSVQRIEEIYVDIAKHPKIKTKHLYNLASLFSYNKNNIELREILKNHPLSDSYVLYIIFDGNDFKFFSFLIYRKIKNLIQKYIKGFNR